LLTFISLVAIFGKVVALPMGGQWSIEEPTHFYDIHFQNDYK
jgi:hypothetical protein